MTLSTQFITIITMVVSGVYLGASYHTFKRLERLWTSSILWKYVLEMLFWLIQAAILYFVLFLVNEGILRLYIFLAVLCGYAMFKSLFEQAFGRIVDTLIRIVLHIYRFIYRIVEIFVVKPIVFIVSLVVVCITKVFTGLYSLLLLLLKVVGWPIKVIVSILSPLLPKNAKKYLHLFYRFYSKIKRKE
ncbi:spore cortex biosynthesis protein YabQ [Gracilibacillus salitolerans]|uniref:Spore cortex biosynthesis protein YabQ n=1 Tax=Gracilibacillus salitolerans TaxID=2663022 RepID=A0A5Q2TEQ0_9BACI|nr:spore cortex biosynthesis protein YabQ [Gracilibacillus salitolerans]QGH32657.1 spore cortex biosynthesis protein YabQ [Gracilibacillus salitolerans]